MSRRRVIVAGAGASGLVAAIEAAKRGYSVIILEAGDKPGKKIYATGNGKCNLTNTKMDTSCFNGTDRKLISSVIERFGYEETIKLFSELGLMFKDRKGYIYPASGQASSVVEALVMECRRVDIKILCNTAVKEIKKTGNEFIIKTTEKDFTADGVILSSGSEAGILKKKLPEVSGYDIARRSGHAIIPLMPALTGIKCKNKSFYKAVSGVRCDGEIQLYSDDTMAAKDIGELQMTDYGVSGIPAFQICRHAAYSLADKKNTYVIIDFMPEIKREQLLGLITDKIKRNPDNYIEGYLNGMINSKLSLGILGLSGIDVKTTGHNLTPGAIETLAGNIKEYRDIVEDTNDSQSAQVMAGGVSLREVTRNLQSVYVKNLYITGELLDTDGICGGYNLQWAWATGYIAGSHILENQEADL